MLFLAALLDLTERLEGGLWLHGRANWPGAIVSNVAMDTDFRGIRFDGRTLVVRIPIRFQRRGGRKRIVALTAAMMRALAEG